MLDFLLLAASSDVAHFYRGSVRHDKKQNVQSIKSMETSPTSAVTALWDSTIVRETSVGQAFKVVLRTVRPAAFESPSRCRFSEVEADNILAIHLTLEVDERVDVEGLLFLQFETPLVSLVIILSEGNIQQRRTIAMVKIPKFSSRIFFSISMNVASGTALE